MQKALPSFFMRGKALKWWCASQMGQKYILKLQRISYSLHFDTHTYINIHFSGTQSWGCALKINLVYAPRVCSSFMCAADIVTTYK